MRKLCTHFKPPITTEPAQLFDGGRSSDAAAQERQIALLIGGHRVGLRGPANINAFLLQNDCQVVAACDLDSGHLPPWLRKNTG